MKMTQIIVGISIAMAIAFSTPARSGPSQIVVPPRGILVSWWAADAHHVHWGKLNEVPRVGDYIRSTNDESGYRQIYKVASVADGSIYLRVGPPGPFQ